MTLACGRSTSSSTNTKPNTARSRPRRWPTRSVEPRRKPSSRACRVTLILDAGALIAAERGDRDVIALVKAERLVDRSPRSHGGVVAQVWRGGAGRQVRLARLLAGVDVAPLDDQLGRASGVLLGQSGTSDAVDAAVVAICRDGDIVLTSDPGDIFDLARASGTHLEIVAV